MNEVTEALLESGIRLLQYRDKRGCSRELFDAGRELADRVHRAKGTFVINDRTDVAMAAGADGVHLGQDDLPVEMARKLLPHGKIVGISTHSAAQVENADQSSADYIAFGPVFPTGSKGHPDPVLGLKGLEQARRLTRKPLVAIGGITVERAKAVIEAGADSIAVIGGLLGAPDLSERAQRFLEALQDINS